MHHHYFERYDICECGDYKWQHRDQWAECGPCKGDANYHEHPCLMFRLHQRAHMTWKSNR